LVIAGNSTPQSPDIEKVCRGSFRSEKINKEVYEKLNIALDLFECYLKKFLTCCKVIMMPGLEDVGSALLPQKPLNSCLFGGMAFATMLELASNPCFLTIEGKQFLGTSGENVKDALLYSKLGDPIKIMKKQMRWRHICPTAPDTLRSYPFESEDPFILKNTPNVYFIGNQKEYSTEVVEKKGICLRLISIPKFSLTRSIVLLDAETLETFQVCLAQNK
jgi:DNA polymerase delta subunit 2